MSDVEQYTKIQYYNVRKFRILKSFTTARSYNLSLGYCYS